MVARIGAHAAAVHLALVGIVFEEVGAERVGDAVGEATGAAVAGLREGGGGGGEGGKRRESESEKEDKKKRNRPCITTNSLGAEVAGWAAERGLVRIVVLERGGGRLSVGFRMS